MTSTFKLTLSMLCMVVFSLLLTWEVNFITMIVTVVLSLVSLNQVFSYSETVFFLTENLSSVMITLSLLLCFFSFLCTPEIKNKMYMFLILVLSMTLVGAFSVNNIILFYLFFEISLIPTLVLIISWGYQPERLQAGTYMMMYTVGASLPLLVYLISTGLKLSSFNMFVIQCINLNINSFWLILAMLVAFLVKLPMYMFHLWLPKAHVEAPLAGSMILAGILLKLGGYGLFIMFKMFNINILSSLLVLIMSLSMFGGLLAAIMCMQQMDVKSFVAYSSVAHMSLVVVGVLMNTTWGIMSAKITMFAHGFTSPALFLMAYISYLKVGSRSFLYSGGLLALYPLVSLVWFLMLSVNMAAPPSLNLVGELLMVPVLWILSKSFVFVFMFLMLFSAIYNMYLYCMINHGGSNKLILANSHIKSVSYLGMMSHMIPLLLILNINFLAI